MRRALADAQQGAHPQLAHLLDAEHLDAAAVRLELARDLCHALGIEVVRGAIGQAAPELNAIGDDRGSLDRLLRRRSVTDQHHFLDAAQHGLGVAHPTVVRVRAVRPLLRADGGARVSVLVLAVAQPERHALDAPSLQPARGRGGHPTRPPRPAATSHAVDEQDPVGGDRAPVDQRRVVLQDVELAPLDRLADHPARRGIQRSQVAGDLLVLLVDGDGQDIGLDGGRIDRFGAKAHAGLLVGGGEVTPLG